MMRFLADETSRFVLSNGFALSDLTLRQ